MKDRNTWRLWGITLVVGLLTIGLNGCAEAEYGVYDYPAYGYYYPYAYESPFYAFGLGRDFDRHHHRPYEDEAIHDGHFGHFAAVEHGPIAAAHPGGFGGGVHMGGLGGMHLGGFGGGEHL